MKAFSVLLIGVLPLFGWAIELDHELSYEASVSQSQWVQSEFRLDSHAHVTLGNTVSLSANTRLIQNTEREWRQPSHFSEVRQLYLSMETDFGYWRIGKQFYNWSEMDGLSAFATVSPRSFKRFILDTFDEQALGQWMVRGQFYWGDWVSELVYSWAPASHRLPDDNEFFAFRAPRLRFGAPAPSGRNQQANTQYVPPSSQLGALKLSKQFNDLSLGVQWRRGPDFEPSGQMIIEPATKQPLLLIQHPLFSSYTLLGNYQLGNVLLRGQVRHSIDRSFTVRNETGLPVLQKLEQTITAIGVDYSGPNQWFVNAQVLVDHITNAPVGLIRPARDVISSVLVKKGFANDKWHASLRWYASNSNDGLVLAKTDYQLSDDIDISVGINLFYGDSHGLFGQYASQDRVFMRLTGYF